MAYWNPDDAEAGREKSFLSPGQPGNMSQIDYVREVLKQYPLPGVADATRIPLDDLKAFAAGGHLPVPDLDVLHDAIFAEKQRPRETVTERFYRRNGLPLPGSEPGAAADEVQARHRTPRGRRGPAPGSERGTGPGK